MEVANSSALILNEEADEAQPCYGNVTCIVLYSS